MGIWLDGTDQQWQKVQSFPAKLTFKGCDCHSIHLLVAILAVRVGGLSCLVGAEMLSDCLFLKFLAAKYSPLFFSFNMQ